MVMSRFPLTTIGMNRRTIRAFFGFGEDQAGPGDIYYPGELSPTMQLRPTPMEESQSSLGPVGSVNYAPEWRRPQPVIGIPGTILPTYRDQTILRRSAKDRILRTLDIIPGNIHHQAASIPGLRSIPQPPTYFADGVPGFGEVPMGMGRRVVPMGRRLAVRSPAGMLIGMVRR